MFKNFLGANFQKYISNTFWLILEKFFTLGLSVVIGIYVARYLQPEAYGMLNYAMSFVGIFSTFTTMGVDRILIRELTKYPEKQDDLLGTCFVLKIIGSGIVITLIVIIISLMKSAPLTNALILIIAAAELFHAFEVVDSFYQSKVLSKYVVRVQMTVNLIGNLLKIVLILSQASVVWFAAITAINVALNALGYIYTYRKHNGNLIKWSFQKYLAVMLLKESWPITLFGVAVQTQAKIDQVMLGKLMNNYEVGQYSVGMRIIEMFGFIPMMLMNTFSPPVTKARQISVALYQDRIVNFYRLMFILFLLVATPIFLFGEWGVVILYGEDFRPAGYLFSLFSFRLFFANIGVGKNFYIVNESLFKNSLLSAICGAVTNISLNFLLIPIYGAIGSIISSMISLTVMNFVVDIFFAKTRENLRLVFRGIFSFWKLDKVS